MEKSCIYRFRSDFLREKLSEISGIPIFMLISLQYTDFHLYLYAATLKYKFFSISSIYFLLFSTIYSLANSTSNQMAIFEVKEDSIQHIINMEIGGILN